MPQPQASTAYTLHPAAAAREVAGEIFVVTDDRGLHRLEVPTAVTIFRSLMAGPASREALIARLVEDFEVDWDVAAGDLDQFVAVLVERRIAVPCEPNAASPLSRSDDPTTLSGTLPRSSSDLSPGSRGTTPNGAPLGAASAASTAVQHKK